MQEPPNNHRIHQAVPTMATSTHLELRGVLAPAARILGILSALDTVVRLTGVDDHLMGVVLIGADDRLIIGI